ncbi:DNA segregation ATPase FtsK/SpoIIIE, S-DNA-T family [[Lactobacillus] rogosae]|uniref:FtsK/SpoIIIE family DNA translocase n=1 Tax=[Lactobacillus] rogosae TaxID=706562 RepID=UPI0008EC6E72|nr:DNA translocase FtsK [Eubacterium sp.]SFE40807.1 DNA segregation ATPase FtsK/SpoIIIE, S-DNA-T family [Lactobacillus rogosae]
MASGRSKSTGKKTSSTKRKTTSNSKSGKTSYSGNSNTTKKSSNYKGNGTKSPNARGSGSQSSSSRNTGSNSSQMNNQLRDEIVFLIALACAIILLLSNFNMAGIVGRSIKWFMFGLFGIAAYIVPVIIAVSIMFMLANKDIIGVMKIKAAMAYVLSVIAAALWQRVTNVPDIKEPVGTYFTYCSEYKTGGGLFGGILCKMLNPLGMAGSLVILIILAIICIIVITEKSFIKGIRNGGERIVSEARKDYSEYKEHSNRVRMLQEEAREEAPAKSRMNNVVRGVTNDLTIYDDNRNEGSDIDITEIEAVDNEDDMYSDDIYDPLITPMPRISREPVWELHVDSASEENISTHQDNAEDNIIKNAADGSDDMYKSEDNGLGEIIQSTANTDIEDKANSGTENIVNSYAENTADSSAESSKQYKFPPVSLLNRNTNSKASNLERENRDTAITLKQTLQNFGVKVDITDISCGPSVTRYELKPELGVKVSRIVSLADDIKLSLAAADIRIEAPIPGKSAIGIEVPNKEAGSVFLRELIETDTFKNTSSKIAFAAGKDIAGKTIVADIARMPHLLIAGATGSGKSVCINTIIMSILYKARPDEVKLIMVDPKVVELSIYNGIPHLLLPVVTEPKKAAGALNWAVNEMNTRYKKFAGVGARNLKGYNDIAAKMEFKEGEIPVEKLPEIVIIIDELADLMMVAPGEVEDAICRLAQLARAAGIHMVIATQRPSVNVITGLIKANVPSRIAFSVSSGVDSRTILDMNGAEKLLGKGDMLYFPSNIPKPIRVQGAFVSDEEVSKVVQFLKDNMSGEVNYDESITETAIASKAGGQAAEQQDDRDSLFADAGRFVIEKERGSIGMLQRQFKIGFNRAGRIMDQLADAGVVGPEIGTKPRKVLMTAEEFEEFIKNI